MNKLDLGKKVRDKITGFEGVVTAVADYLNGCTRVCVQPQSLKEKDGGTVGEEWFDDTQLNVLINSSIVKDVQPDEEPIGGPQKDPPSHKNSA